MPLFAKADGSFRLTGLSHDYDDPGYVEPRDLSREEGLAWLAETGLTLVDGVASATLEIFRMPRSTSAKAGV